VENVQSAAVELTSFDKETRTLRGIITATTDDGESLTVEV
jgi:hypothetical protein